MRAQGVSTQVARLGVAGVDDVQLVWWPEQAQLRTAGPATTARLLLVAPNAEPPARAGFLEDWVRRPLDPAEFATRRAELVRRLGAAQPLTLDEDGLVRRGRAWVALSAIEVALVRPLFERRGHVVGRSELLEAARAHTAATYPSFLDTYIGRLRDRLAPLGATVRTVRGVGHVLEVGEVREASASLPPADRGSK